MKSNNYRLIYFIYTANYFYDSKTYKKYYWWE